MVYHTFSEEETRLMGEKFANTLSPGTIIALHGEIGAGKSVFARGIAKGLGITGPIPSPTFTILQMYTQGRLPLYHFDWYRIEDEEELYAIGVQEYLFGQGISLIEWPSQGKGILPEDHISIEIIKQKEPLERELVITYREKEKNDR
ncbi:MAG: tRNA (adenosine(37)-N6)-threonylcarbamoyltransferase complex ATPase subunit type 1 TsaE [Clostridiales bacterium]|nr:tRNA (adenosine(37)-N6)-threonylcarbamoyltransferase complex ATPase subunit type 1 TsaE [Clostridiales bacterium]